MRFVRVLCLFGCVHVCMAENDDSGWVAVFERVSQDNIVNVVKSTFEYFFVLSNIRSNLSFDPKNAAEGDPALQILYKKIKAWFGEEGWKFLLEKSKESTNAPNTGMPPWMDKYHAEYDPDYPKKVAKGLNQFRGLNMAEDPKKKTVVKPEESFESDETDSTPSSPGATD